MRNFMPFFGLALLCLALTDLHAQSVDSLEGKVINFPSRLLSRIQSRTAGLNSSLTRQTEKYLQKMARREARMRQRLYTIDSNAAKTLFANSAQKYAALGRQMQTDPGAKGPALSGIYQPYLDSLQGSLAFLKQNPQLLTTPGASLSPQALAQLQGANSCLQKYEMKMLNADAIKAYIQQRKQEMGQFLRQHANLQSLLGRNYAGINKDVYYYSQQLREYKEMWNNPDRLEKKALALLNRLPDFRNFMKNNSQLSGLFQPPGGGGSAAQALPGLQTHTQVAQQVQGQVLASGAAGMDAFQSKLQLAQSQLDGYKSKISQLGAGNTAADIPEFRPNESKTKPFWGRLEYGANFQTTHTNYYYPIVTDLGISLGYRLGHGKVVGIGASYKIGWGSGIQHIAITGQGAGLRSFLQVGIKGGFSAAGGFEYNYTTPFTSYQQLKRLQYWTKSGLIGIAKTVSINSRVFKKTQLQLLWDFLSYCQMPKTQPVLFRIGYKF